jgi:EmrB/QacA subfamily drug resistance transporter
MSDTTVQATQVARPTNSRRWIALAFIAVAQLMIALDATIVNIALPSAQSALRFSDADRQWVVTGYTLAFGGLLLLGGRVADWLGRKPAFLIGLAGFAAASAVGGTAGGLGVLVAARACQGAFAALLAPTALSLLAVTFTQPRERAKAFAVYGAIAGSGAAVGLVLGGLLTENASWRWCLYVNVPIALIAAVGCWLFIPGSRAAGHARFDIVGAALATGGLIALVYACSEAVRHGWGSGLVIGSLVASAVLLTLFVVRESRIASPLLPLRIVLDRNRAGAYVSVVLAIAGVFGLFLFLTYYLQVVLGYSPLQAGLAFLPLTAATLIGSGAIATQLLPRVPPRALIVPALLVAAAAMALLTQLEPDSGYLTVVLPAEILLGFGISCVMVPAISTATYGVSPREAGVASAVVNTAQQVGGSIGTAVLNSIAAAATASFLVGRASSPSTTAEGLVHGYAVASGWAAAALVLAAVLAFVLITAPAPGEQQH